MRIKRALREEDATIAERERRMAEKAAELLERGAEIYVEAGSGMPGPFTHKEIRIRLGYGGSPQHFLLFDGAKGRVTAACLSKDKNPGAPELDFAHFWNFLLKSTAYGLASFGANPLKCLSVFSKCAKSS
jgi:hypothetical protein